jgi:S1-C subfamily serine protease
MPDTESSEFSRVCPFCGRRVPRKVAVCRCGAEIGDDQNPLETPTLAAQPAQSSVSGSAILLGVALVTVGLGAFWLNRPGPSPAPRAEAPTPAPAIDPSADSRPLTPALALPANTPDPASVPSAPVAVSTPLPEAPIVPPSLEDVVSRTMPAVVLVETSSGRGSGFFVSADTLITNVHVVGGNSSVTIRRMGGATAPARVAASSPEFDIAVLKISSPEAGQAVISLGSAVNARVGQDVIAIGSALGTLQNTVTRGIVSALRQTGSATLIQTDAAVNPGNSGGPLLDRSGVAIGITTMGYSGRQGLNFAVAAEHARALLEGRPAPAAASVSRADDLRTLSPTVPSEAEQVRTAGIKALEQTLAQIARQGQVMDDYWARFRRACYEGRVVSAGLDHEWFALFDDRAMQGAVGPGCGATFADVQKRATDLRDGVIAADEAARQAGIYPGVRRDARRKYRLDYPGFDR